MDLADVVARPLDPRNSTVQENEREVFAFSGDPRKLVRALRKMADDIEADRILIDQVRLVQRVKSDDFYLQSLIIRFNEKVLRGIPPHSEADRS